MVKLEDILAGDKIAVARALTQVENGSSGAAELQDALLPHSGGAHLIGITGAPGTGKSSLVNALAYHYRNRLEDREPPRIAIISVDPTSPFTGGAILGDRIRMIDVANDPGVFIRSMATCGAFGGLAMATSAMSRVFDAAGYEIILIETVGAGQSEVEIASLAHTTLVIEVPGLGDDIQAIKAGIMEIADIFVINKADYPGVEEIERILRANLMHSTIRKQTDKEIESRWEPPILKTIATTNQGISLLVDKIQLHREWLLKTDQWLMKEVLRLQQEFDEGLRFEVFNGWLANLPPKIFDEVHSLLSNREITPSEAIKRLVGREERG